jgi:transposase
VISGSTTRRCRTGSTGLRIDAAEGSPEGLTTSEREELVKLRRENTRLKLEREILNKAAAFFARESTR